MAARLRRLIGTAAERRAEHMLRRRGLTLVTRNWQCRHGEIDLVMRDGDTLVFVEVRHRAHTAWVDGAYSIDVHKQQRLRRAAELFLASRGVSSRQPCRFDVVCSTGSDHSTENNSLEWITDAF